MDSTTPWCISVDDEEDLPPWQQSPETVLSYNTAAHGVANDVEDLPPWQPSPASQELDKAFVEFTGNKVENSSHPPVRSRSDPWVAFPFELKLGKFNIDVTGSHTLIQGYQLTVNNTVSAPSKCHLGAA